MPQYFSPGVYVEEVDSGPRPIQGVSTSVTGMVGVTVRGPTSGKPELVTSFNEFVQKFGGYLPEPSPDVRNKWDDPAGEGGYWWLFPHAVKGFFDNGGQQLYVKRVFSRKAAVSSAATFGIGLVSEIKADAAKKSTTLQVRHLIGLHKGKQVKIFNGSTRLEISPDGGPGPYTIDKYDEQSKLVTLDKAVGEAISANRGDYIEVHAIQPEPANKSLQFTAKAKGAWGNSIHARVRPMVGSTVSLLHDEGSDPTSVVTVLAANVPGTSDTISVEDAGLNDGDVVRIQGAKYTLSDLPQPDPKNFKISPSKPADQTWSQGSQVRKLRRANVAANSVAVVVSGADRLYVGGMIELDNEQDKEAFVINKVEGQKVTLSRTTTKQYHEGDLGRVIEAEATLVYHPGQADETEEVFTNLRLTNDASPSDLVNRIEGRSSLVSVVNLGGAVSSLANFPIANEASFRKLGGGSDGLPQLDVDDFQGIDEGADKRTGIQALEDIDDISLVAVPGIWSPVVRASLIQHCETMKYRFAIIDPPPRLSIGGIQSYRSPIDTRFAAIYYPWLRLRDPSTSQNVAAPPSGHMAGIYARVDTERGVHKAPANEVIRGILPANPATGIGGLLQDVTKREQDLLNPDGINALRFFPGRGQRVWGARTVSSDTNFKYVNVRRIFNFIEASIDQGTQFVVFEPNDATLWARVRQTIKTFLNTQWRNGILEGAVPEDAYFVECDRGATMTQDDIENGRLICEVGIAPVFPAEFVIFRIQKFTSENKLT